MASPIRLGFADFWAPFDPHDNYFTNLLNKHFQIEVCDRPDFLIYSCFGRSFRRHKGIRIYYTGENKRPNWRECDYAFTFDYDSRTEHYRLPLYALYGDVHLLTKRETNAKQVLASKTKFCNFLYSNPKCEIRNTFFQLLSRYKHVDSGGKVLNNMGTPVLNKLEFIRDYKFTIAFENASYPGYTTEKIAEPMFVSSLPIYWGNPLVHLDFNPKSFINFHDLGSLEALVDRVIEVDQNDELYLEYLQQPWFPDNRVNQFVHSENIVSAFRKIFDTPKKPIAGWSRWAPQSWWVPNQV